VGPFADGAAGGEERTAPSHLRNEDLENADPTEDRALFINFDSSSRAHGDEYMGLAFQVEF
jgi:hypothetical protein